MRMDIFLSPALAISKGKVTAFRGRTDLPDITSELAFPPQYGHVQSRTSGMSSPWSVMY